MKHLRPRRWLGQSFLTHEAIADDIVSCLSCGSSDTVLEIGPGKGILTRRLLQRAGRVIAVEIDERLAAGLAAELQSDRLSIVHGDFLTFDITAYRDLRIIGNLPYNLAAPMLFRLLESLESWRVGVFTTQREFALRILAEPGTRDYGPAAVFFSRVCGRERLFNIEPTAFKPQPEVVSTVFRLTRLANPVFDVADEKLFRRVVKAAFAHRRKMVSNSLMSLPGFDRGKILKALEKAEIDPTARAECLKPVQFELLARALGFEASSSA